MHQIRMILTAVLLSLVIAGSACASDVPVKFHNGEVVETTTVSDQSQKKGFFARLWELEKKKNAAILRFLGWKR